MKGLNDQLQYCTYTNCFKHLYDENFQNKKFKARASNTFDMDPEANPLLNDLRSNIAS